MPDDTASLPPIFRSRDPEGRARRLFDYRPAGQGEAWVFAYGSLMWDPGFPVLEARPALLHGYHRRFCVYSYRYRGTPEQPGLVLGLDKGGACRGIVYRIAESDLEEISAYLWDREMGTGVYHPVPRRFRTQSGPVEALAFIVNRRHTEYAGRLSREQVAALVALGIGGRGRNRDYLLNTIGQLRDLGVADRSLLALDRLVEQIATGALAMPALILPTADPDHF
ncbi:MAG: gamma-glutamylcyclotransferase [Alphaproteobacteria bacterium]|nr:gamma-glutamylcyclotransferase [Alphaproteobacteria bacterium]MBU0798085.1 gamma-glutamylcyclotransferase [Alphaproteobacteria bacterium]MBU0888785.1 gamma-glutamylcyclotransferase [Alphaproteobacteria bacterium]MBU1812496.1 gamma-glutamylcyclotransferase [Alphaproteobacteria bacterium]